MKFNKKFFILNNIKLEIQIIQDSKGRVELQVNELVNKDIKLPAYEITEAYVDYLMEPAKLH